MFSLSLCQHPELLRDMRDMVARRASENCVAAEVDFFSVLNLFSFFKISCLSIYFSLSFFFFSFSCVFFFTFYFCMCHYPTLKPQIFDMPRCITTGGHWEELTSPRANEPLPATERHVVSSHAHSRNHFDLPPFLKSFSFS